MRQITFLLLFLVGTNYALLAGEQRAPVAGQTSREIINTMLAKIDADNTLKFNLKTWERINGKDFFSDADVKLQNKPEKLYVHSNAEPNKNVEILYNEALYGKKVKVNPGKFLPTLSMDPYGSRLRKDQHHVVLRSGFTFLRQIIGQAVKKADKEAQGQFETLFKYDGDVVWEGRKCFQITITDPTFKYVDHTVKNGETVESIECNDNICGYMIIEKNPNVHGFDGLKDGMTVKMPTSYAKKTVLLIDKETYLPIVQTMSDETGQFERYEFHNVQVNPNISDDEFTTKWKDYKF